MAEPQPSRTEIGRIHERMDQIVQAMQQMTRENQQMAKDVAVIATNCGPCQKRLGDLETTIDGNGQPGLKQRVAVVESGRTDTLTVKSVTILLGAIGTLAATIIGALVALLTRTPPTVGP